MCSAKSYALLLILPMLLMALFIDGEEGKQEELKIRNDPSSTASDQQKQPELAMPSTDPSGKKNPDKNNPDLNPNLKDSDENNSDEKNDPDKKDSKETKNTKEPKDSHETDETFDLDGNHHGDQAGVGQDQEPVKATVDPSKPTFKKILPDVAEDKAEDMPFCQFEFAEYTGKQFDKVVPAEMREWLLTSNTTFAELKKWHLDAEEENISGSDVDIKEEALLMESVPAEIFESNMDLMMGGAKEMVKIFTRWAEQGPELLKLIHLDESSAKFTVDAGLTNSQVRLARNIYCVKKLALNLQTKLRSGNVSPIGQSVAGKGKMEVHFAIPIVWIASKSVPKMKEMAKVSNVLKTRVNKPNAVTDGPDADKVNDMDGVIQTRKLMATLIKDLAETEDQVALNEKFESIGRGSKKGSSMALMGIIFAHECKSSECVQFFHVYSDDEIYETSEENYEEYW